jgi:hypothetical protein
LDLKIVLRTIWQIVERKNEQRAGKDFQPSATASDQKLAVPMNGTPFTNADYADNVMSSLSGKEK